VASKHSHIHLARRADHQIGGAPMTRRKDNQLPLPSTPEGGGTSTTVRLRFLAEQIYSIGPRGLYELLAELVGGAPPLECIERYGRLAHEYGAFIRALGGDQFPPRFFIVNGNDSNDSSRTY
jgi:hypothetical protein